MRRDIIVIIVEPWQIKQDVACLVKALQLGFVVKQSRQMYNTRHLKSSISYSSSRS